MDADVVVIGAGAAGLAAARRLAEQSFRVILIEARDRLGGRVSSHVVTRAATPAELGAEFIHGTARETMALLREIGGAAIDTAGSSWKLTAAGELQRDERDFLDAAVLFGQAESLPKDESVARFLLRFASDVSKREIATGARLFVEGFEAADPEIASVRAISDEVRSGVDFRSNRPLGGYRPLFDRLHAACTALGVQMSLSTAVRRIAWRSGSVIAETTGDEKRSVRARAAIITVPVGVLRGRDQRSSIDFDPELPADKGEAIGNLEMGHVFKVVLWFGSAFWEQIRDGIYQDAAFFRVEAGAFTAFWTQYPVRSEVVSAWAGGPKADRLRGTSHEQLIARALDEFGMMLGDVELARREFRGGLVHDWGADAFALGAYSYVRVGGENARSKLAVPIERTLFFAGEATSTNGQGGTVNGALETGMRAAGEVAKAFA